MERRRRKRRWTRQDKWKLVILGLVVILFGVATLFATRWVLSLQDPDKRQWFQDVIESMGLGGWFVLLAIQYVQIVIAFIPGGPIQIVAGGLFGPWGGLAACLLGTILASATVFYLVSRYGQSIIRFFVGEKDLKKYRFLQDSKRLEKLVFLLFFIPGTPKDALTYLFALTPIPMGRFMVISIAARMPAVLTSVLAGDQIAKGNWLSAGILFLGISLVSVLGLLAHRKIMDKLSEKRNH